MPASRRPTRTSPTDTTSRVPQGKAPRPIIDNAWAPKPCARRSPTPTWSTAPILSPSTIATCTPSPSLNSTRQPRRGRKPYTFSFTVTVKPEIEISSYEPVEIELPAEGTTDTEIDEQIDALRRALLLVRGRFRRHEVKEDSYIDLAMKATDDKGEEIPSLTTENRPTAGEPVPGRVRRAAGGPEEGPDRYVHAGHARRSAHHAVRAGRQDRGRSARSRSKIVKRDRSRGQRRVGQEQMGFESVEDLRARIAGSPARRPT